MNVITALGAVEVPSRSADQQQAEFRRIIQDCRSVGIAWAVGADHCTCDYDYDHICPECQWELDNGCICGSPLDRHWQPLYDCKFHSEQADRGDCTCPPKFVEDYAPDPDCPSC